MTYREQALQENPNVADKDTFGGMVGGKCPPDVPELKCLRGIPSRENCMKCWEREAVE